MGAAYIGLWSEIVLTDVSKNLNSLYQGASTGRIEFRIGPENRTNLKVTPDGYGNYQVVRTLTLSPTQVTTTNDIVLSDMPFVNEIESIYNRIIANLSNPHFVSTQALNANRFHQQTFDLLRNY